MHILIRDGRHVDEALGSVWAKVNEEGLAGMSALADHLLQTGQLREGIATREVRDVLWNYLAIDHYERLVLQRHWTPRQFAIWLTHAMITSICP